MASQQSTYRSSGWMNDNANINTDSRITQEERDYKIDRVNYARTDSEILGADNMHISEQQDYKIAYQVIARLVYPDK